jgi:hypothetical protein
MDRYSSDAGNHKAGAGGRLAAFLGKSRAETEDRILIFW